MFQTTNQHQGMVSTYQNFNNDYHNMLPPVQDNQGNMVSYAQYNTAAPVQDNMVPIVTTMATYTPNNMALPVQPNNHVYYNHNQSVQQNNPAQNINQNYNNNVQNYNQYGNYNQGNQNSQYGNQFSQYANLNVNYKTNNYYYPQQNNSGYQQYGVQNDTLRNDNLVAQTKPVSLNLTSI